MSLLSTSRLLGAAALLVACMTQTSVALAGTSGGIAGMVTNAQTGAPLAGVQLRITSPSETVTTKTDSKGHFIVFELQPDNYTITASKDGFTARALTGTDVEADQTQRVQVQLTPSSESGGGAAPQ